MELGKILNFPPLYGPWDLEKFHAPTSSWALGLSKILSSASIQALGFEKMLSFPFLQLQPAGEVSLFCLLYISSKLFLLTYNCRPLKCEWLGRILQGNDIRTRLNMDKTFTVAFLFGRLCKLTASWCLLGNANRLTHSLPCTEHNKRTERTP